VQLQALIAATENQQVHGIPVNPTSLIAFLIGETYNLLH